MNELSGGFTNDLKRDEQASASKKDSATFASIFVVSFIVFLMVALCAQMVALPWRSWFPGAEGQKSLVGGVRTSVYTFMSYLN